MKRCIITGASGLIGSRLVAALAQDWELHAVGRRKPTAANVEWHRMDLSVGVDATRLPAHADAVVHLAQSEHFREFPAHAAEVFQVNTFSVLRLLDYARAAGARTFVYASSGGVYGPGDASLNETAPLPTEGNLGFYLATKVCSEIVAQNYADSLNVVILRFFFVYGPGQRPSMLVPRLIESVRTGRPIVLHGTNGLRLNPVYVDDAASAVTRALSLQRSYKINVAGPEVVNLRELGERIGRAIGRTPVYRSENEKPRHLVGDISRMCELLVPPRVRLDEGLRLVLRAANG